MNRVALATILVCLACTPSSEKSLEGAFSLVEPGSCPNCTLHLEDVATLGKPDDAELISHLSGVVPIDDGGFVVWGRDLMLRFDADGNYRETVGSIGDGSGEYRGMQSVTNALGD